MRQQPFCSPRNDDLDGFDITCHKKGEVYSWSCKFN